MSRKILLVDDDRGERSLISVAFESEGAEVITCENGREALEYLRGNEPGTPHAPAVIFLDLLMPDVNGFEVLREFQRQAQANRIPVVVFTASRADADIYLSYKFGANAFVIKPKELGRLQRVAQISASFWLNANVLPPVL